MISAVLPQHSSTPDWVVLTSSLPPHTHFLLSSVFIVPVDPLSNKQQKTWDKEGSRGMWHRLIENQWIVINPTTQMLELSGRIFKIAINMSVNTFKKVYYNILFSPRLYKSHNILLMIFPFISKLYLKFFLLQFIFYDFYFFHYSWFIVFC